MKRWLYVAILSCVFLNKMVSFDYVNSIEVSTSMITLFDTATVKVPRKMQWKGKFLTDYLRVEDKITIQIGYEEYGLQTVFSGYLKHIENSTPLVLTCENEMRLFKKKTVAPEIIDIEELEKYVKRYFPDISCKVVGSLPAGKMDIKDNRTMVRALEDITRTYPYLQCHFRNNEFYIIQNTCTYKDAKTAVFDPTRNMISDSLKSELSEDRKIVVKATSVTNSNEVLTAYAPREAIEEKKQGEKPVFRNGYSVQQELYCPECVNEQQLQEHVNKVAAGWLANRMTGSFTSFGVPFVRKGDIVELRDDDRPERHKKRFIAESVNYHFGTQGYRQIITLGYQVTEEKQ